MKSPQELAVQLLCSTFIILNVATVIHCALYLSCVVQRQQIRSAWILLEVAKLITMLVLLLQYASVVRTARNNWLVRQQNVGWRIFEIDNAPYPNDWNFYWLAMLW